MLDVLAERRFPVSEVVALASSRSIGREVSFGDKVLKCRNLENYDFTDTDICLMSAGGDVSREFSPKIGAKGCVVIDDSSAFRIDPKVPLIVPKVNAEAVRFRAAELPSSPMQLLDRAARRGAETSARRGEDLANGRVDYRSVSGAGKEAINEFFRRRAPSIVSDPIEAKKYPSASPSTSFRT